MAPPLPLAGVTVLDFSTLLPGPLATLLLAEAGAEVIKIERPGGGDDMRGYQPALGPVSANFALLNRGKRSLAVDLKDAAGRRRLDPLIARADVLVEQFRPGVMDRLGLGWEALRQLNPRLIYCSISGYGADGPRAAEAGHDLNYMAVTGALALGADAAGRPALPGLFAADIAGGAYPAVINILLALQRRAAGGGGCRIEQAMAANLFPLMYWGLGAGFAAGAWPRPGAELCQGGSPRYNLYPTADGRWLAVGALEEKFWQTFCHAIALPEPLRHDAADPAATRAAVAERVAAASAEHWRALFAGRDVCATVVASLDEAVRDPQFAPLFGRQVGAGAAVIPALPLPLAEELRRPEPLLGSPALGEMEG